MSEIALQLFKDLGVASIGGIVVGLLLIWTISHYVAQAGARVSILWGMIQYTKKRDVNLTAPDNLISTAHGQPVAARLASDERKCEVRSPNEPLLNSEWVNWRHFKHGEEGLI